MAKAAILRAAIGGVLLLVAGAARADELVASLAGTAATVYDPAQGCSGIDEPDMNPRAFRDADGHAVMFALHYVAHPLRGPDLDHLVIDCRSALDSPLDPEPSHFADRLYVASTWTRDGAHVGALIHEEYHADEHDRCAGKDSLACWYNTVLGFHSGDGGARFERSRPLVVAAAPFTQDVGQGRHRGFFEPSNMFGDGRFVYAFVSTTGWDGQDAGSCLFRTDDPTRSDRWRAYDGRAFATRYADPYRSTWLPQPCAVIAPFAFAVNSVVRHAPSGLWLAVLQASAGSGAFPVDGFYYASSRDLLHWSPARLLLAGRTLYSNRCGAGAPQGGDLVNYPAVLDPASASRNFDAVGPSPFLYFVAMEARGCGTGHRLLLRRPLAITVRHGDGQRDAAGAHP